MSRKSERVLKLIAALLDTRRPLTRHEIQERVEGYSEDPEAFRRTFERDKDMIRSLDIPLRIESVDDGVDGYRIPGDEYRLEDPGLEGDELAAINLAAHRVRLSGVDPTTGLQKLGGLTDGFGAGSELATLPASPHAPAILRAFGMHARVQFRYNDKDRAVDPFRLHLERGRWYLKGHDHSAGDARVFRLDRVEGAVSVDEAGSATVEPTGDEADVQVAGWVAGTEEPVVAEVWVDAQAAAVARRVVSDDAQIAEQADGSIIVTLTVRRREALRNFVLGFLDRAELLSPPELRADVVDWLRSEANRSPN